MTAYDPLTLAAAALLLTMTAAIREALVARDSKSPMALNFKRRVDSLEDTLRAR